MVRDRDRARRRASAARLASSTRMTPLSMNGPLHCSRSQRDVVPGRRRRLHPLAVGAEEGRGSGRPGAPCSARSGPAARPDRTNSSSQRGRTEGLGREPRHRRDSRAVRGSYGLPQSRPWRNDQSSVAMIPTAPAARARSMRSGDLVARARPVDLEEGAWGWPPTTSSTGLLANELSPIAVPRAAAARATATSPSGWTAWTPVGEISTGSESRLAHHGRRQVALSPAGRRRAARSRARRRPRRCRPPSSPRSEPATQRAVDGPGQPCAWPGAAPRRRSRTTGRPPSQPRSGDLDAERPTRPSQTRRTADRGSASE